MTKLKTFGINDGMTTNNGDGNIRNLCDTITFFKFFFPIFSKTFFFWGGDGVEGQVGNVLTGKNLECGYCKYSR